jgi:hypothetical protein
MPTVATFRALLIASAVFLLAAILLRASGVGLPPAVVAQQRETAPLFGDWASFANYFVGMLFLVIFAWAIVALYSFRLLAKGAGLAAILLFATWPIVRGPSIESGWSLSFEHLACSSLAAALVLAFATPLK